MLKATYTNRVRVIYIDPPYNTGNKDWVYNDRYLNQNDRYRHSLWLEFLYRRLLLARDLLAPDGVILVSINDENRAKLELLMDQVFQGMRVGSFVWRKRRPSNAAVDYFFSSDHEHVLVYARLGFEFKGSKKQWSGYSNWDEAKEDHWTSGDLTLGFNKEQRKNLYYPLCNPKTDIWYPCDPNNVWRYATKERLKGREVRTQPMEAMIAENRIYFPDEPNPALYQSVVEIQTAIETNTAPKFLDTAEDFHFWIGKRIGRNKPRFKRYAKDLKRQEQPLSSWISIEGNQEKIEEYENFTIQSGLTSEGTKTLREINLGSVFPYPKPLSLIKNLLEQATQPGDLVLDFFAGSGTTAQAVLTLNTEDDGNRQFILISSTEAPLNDPDRKNLCRDVCAERVRRVIQGYRDKPGAGGGFAYVRLQRIAPADLRYDLDAESIWNTLCLRLTAAIRPYPNQRLNIISQNAESALVLCPAVDEDTLAELQALPVNKLVVYSDRPASVAEALAAMKTVDSRSLREAAMAGQGGK